MFGLTSQDGRHRGDTGQGQRIRIRWEPRSRRSSFSPSSSTSGSAEAENAEAIMASPHDDDGVSRKRPALIRTSLEQAERTPVDRSYVLSFFYFLKARPSPRLCSASQGDGRIAVASDVSRVAFPTTSNTHWHCSMEPRSISALRNGEETTLEHPADQINPCPVAIPPHPRP